MKDLFNYISVIFLFTLGLLPTLRIHALAPDFYVAHSALSEGRWVRINVNSTGMHLVPDATLRAMGFADPTKVKVYGTGGMMLPEYLDNSVPDDLPPVPSVKTSKGIVFFGMDDVNWSAQSGSVPYTHFLNAYSSDSYYFLSDREMAESPMPRVEAPDAADGAETVFIDRLLHEQDLEGPDETGRIILGEDFRTQKTRNFKFSLPGAISGTGYISVRFGAKATAATSLSFTANGNRLPAYSTDQIKAVSGSNFISYVTPVKSFDVDGENLSLDLTFNAAGTVSKALLDYIEVFYPREIRKSDSFLNFYLDATAPTVARIEGCSSSTRVWDVTNPFRPCEMEILMDGSKAFISVSRGYHNFVAFDPEAVTAQAVTWSAIQNQDIHGMETPDMIIITYDTYREGAEIIADVHRSADSMNVLVLRPEEIYNEFSGGSADVTAFRKMLKMFHDRPIEKKVRYCLLMGKPFYDNKGSTAEARGLGYTPMPIWESITGLSETASYSTDAYIAMLDDCTATSFNMASAIQHVGVGRLPVKSAQEAVTMARKIEKYVKQPAYGSWRNRIMLVADDADANMASSTPSQNSTFFDHTQGVYNLITSSSTGANYMVDRVLLDAYKQEMTSVGIGYPVAKAKMMANINDGVVWTNYIGHASTTTWTTEKLLTWEDINSFSNSKLTFLYGATCSFAYWDGKGVSGAEVMLLNPNAGIIGTIMPSRTVYIVQNARLNNEIAKVMFQRNEVGERNRVGDIYRQGLNNLPSDLNKLRYCLVSDPALALPVPDHTVEFRMIDGVDIAGDPEVLPEIPAQGKPLVEGVILDADGNVAEEFSGTVELQLYDAEKVVETKDFGIGLDRTFNERSLKLSATTVKVENGRWKARLMLPSEITNNYSPALISAYAWNAADGREAHGHTDNLYVYGYDSEADPDTTAPDIESFYLNSKAFVDGGVVNSNPLVFATVYDASGINLSDTGIGHQLSLTLDGKKYFTDVNSYFSSDPEREGAGNICYPLEDLVPGKHTLTLTVWDNTGNSASRTIEFNVGAALDPVISDLSTNVNPASTSVIFSITVDRPNTTLQTDLEVFDLSGRRVWNNSKNATTDMQSVTTTEWDLKDQGGVRVPRGIYLYRATVRTPEGTYTSKTRKLAVTAQ